MEGEFRNCKAGDVQSGECFFSMGKASFPAVPELGVVTHTCSASPWEGKAGESDRHPHPPPLSKEFKAILGAMGPCLNKVK